jgi:hypothetical protein
VRPYNGDGRVSEVMVKQISVADKLFNNIVLATEITVRITLQI